MRPDRREEKEVNWRAADAFGLYGRVSTVFWVRQAPVVCLPPVLGSFALSSVDIYGFGIVSRYLVLSNVS